MVNPKIHEQVESRLARSEIRYTPGRRQVVGVLERAEGPRSASDLYRDLDGNLPLSSLYRSLAVLAEAKVLASHHGKGRVVLYELAEWLVGHHHHRRCEGCGSMDDIKLSSNSEEMLEQIASHVTHDLGFVATGHSLEIVGRCGACIGG